MNAKQAAEFALARGNFQRAWDTGIARLQDRFGNVVKEGDYVVWHPPHDLVWHVDSVGPDPNPNAAPGIVQMRVHVELPVAYLITQKANDLMVVGKRTAPGHSEITGPTMVESHENGQPTEDGGTGKEPPTS